MAGGFIHSDALANANLIAAGIENINFHPVAINRVYKDTTIQ